MQIIGNTIKIKISSPFGAQEGFRTHPHNGIDIPLEIGTKLNSIQDGIVQSIVNFGSENIGKGVIVKLKDGTTAIYGHMSSISVKEGQSIHKGDLIGFSGNTGHSTGAHLHLGLKNQNGQFIDPSSYASEAVNGNYLLDKYNEFADWTVDKELEWLFKPVIKGLEKGLVHFGEWFVTNLPDIMGYTTIGVGAIIILSSMVGKAGMIKTLGWYFAAMILAICILGGV